MKRAFGEIALTLSLALTCAAQDWVTQGNDAQRSGWLRASEKITATSVASGGFGLLWKHETGPSAVTAPVLLDFLISHKGFRSLAFFGAVDGAVYAVDTDLNRREWDRQFHVGGEATVATPDCPGGMTSPVTRPTVAALPAFSFAGPRLRSPGFSGVGKPNEGAVTIEQERSPGFRRPEPPKPGVRQQPPAGPSLFGLKVVHAVTADGMFRTMLVSNGHDHGSPIPFLPAGANARGLMLVEDVAFVATANGCGGVANGVWSLDTATGSISSWKAGAASVTGSGGFAMAPDGTVYAATSDGRVVALDGAPLTEKAAYKGSATYVSAPIVIDYDDKDYLAVAAANGSIELLAASTLAKGPVAKTAAGGGFASDALATWRDTSNVTWVLAPKTGAVEAWKIVESNGKTVLERGWSVAIEAPTAPVVANGIVFAASGRGVLHAIDGASGHQLYGSGDVTGGSPAAGLSAGPNTIYLSSRRGALYAFGFPIEH